MTYANHVNYLRRRWLELGIPEQTSAIAAVYGSPTQAQIEAWRRAGDPRAANISRDLFHLHAPAFHRLLGELYWTEGRKDVGAGRKTSGHHWNGLAEDIVVLKPIDAHGNVVDGPVQLVDAVAGMGGVDAHIGWSLIGPNPDRTWVQPQRPGGSPEPPPAPVPPPPPPPPPGLSYDALLALMRDQSDVYGSAPGWEGVSRGLAEVVGHWSYQLLVERKSVEAIRADYEARKG